jgi:hypothetical protein
MEELAQRATLKSEAEELWLQAISKLEELEN